MSNREDEEIVNMADEEDQCDNIDRVDDEVAAMDVVRVQFFEGSVDCRSTSRINLIHSDPDRSKY